MKSYITLGMGSIFLVYSVILILHYLLVFIVYVRMYVCMYYVCMYYVCMYYVCIHVCMYV